MKMNEIIRTLRLQRGLTLAQVAEFVGVSKPTVLKWENGIIQNMRRDKIAKLAMILGTTPEYLMGWGSQQQDEWIKTFLRIRCGMVKDMSVFSERLKSAIKKTGLSQRELENKTGIPHSAIQRYASGNTDRVPIGRIELLAKALGTTAEYLLGWEEETPAVDNNSRRIDEFVELFSKLSDDQQTFIISSIKGLLSNQ